MPSKKGDSDYFYSFLVRFENNFLVTRDRERAAAYQIAVNSTSLPLFANTRRFRNYSAGYLYLSSSRRVSLSQINRPMLGAIYVYILCNNVGLKYGVLS